VLVVGSYSSILNVIEVAVNVPVMLMTMTAEAQLSTFRFPVLPVAVVIGLAIGPVVNGTGNIW